MKKRLQIWGMGATVGFSMTLFLGGLGIPGAFAATAGQFSYAVYLRGDVTGDGRVNLTDAVALGDYLYRGRRLPVLTRDRRVGDVNQDGGVNLTDVTALFDYLYRGYSLPGIGQPLPAPPFPEALLNADVVRREVGRRTVRFIYWDLSMADRGRAFAKEVRSETIEGYPPFPSGYVVTLPKGIGREPILRRTFYPADSSPPAGTPGPDAEPAEQIAYLATQAYQRAVQEGEQSALDEEGINGQIDLQVRRALDGAVGSGFLTGYRQQNDETRNSYVYDLTGVTFSGAPLSLEMHKLGPSPLYRDIVRWLEGLRDAHQITGFRADRHEPMGQFTLFNLKRGVPIPPEFRDYIDGEEIPASFLINFLQPLTQQAVERKADFVVEMMNGGIFDQGEKLLVEKSGRNWDWRLVPHGGTDRVARFLQGEGLDPAVRMVEREGEGAGGAAGVGREAIDGQGGGGNDGCSDHSDEPDMLYQLPKSKNVLSFRGDDPLEEERGSFEHEHQREVLKHLMKERYTIDAYGVRPSTSRIPFYGFGEFMKAWEGQDGLAILITNSKVKDGVPFIQIYTFFVAASGSGRLGRGPEPAVRDAFLRYWREMGFSNLRVEYHVTRKWANDFFEYWSVYLATSEFRNRRKKDFIFLGISDSDLMVKDFPANIVVSRETPGERFGSENRLRLSAADSFAKELFDVMSGREGTLNLPFKNAFEWTKNYGWRYDGPKDQTDLVLNPYILGFKWIGDLQVLVKFAVPMEQTDFVAQRGQRGVIRGQPVYVSKHSFDKAQVLYGVAGQVFGDLELACKSPDWQDDHTLYVEIEGKDDDMGDIEWFELGFDCEQFVAKAPQAPFTLNGRDKHDPELKEHLMPDINDRGDRRDGFRGYRPAGDWNDWVFGYWVEGGDTEPGFVNYEEEIPK